MCRQFSSNWRAGLEVLKCDPFSLCTFGSSLPRQLRILILDSPLCDGGYPLPPQLCVALRGLTALERLSLIEQDLMLDLAPLLAALQHKTLLTHLNFCGCILPGLPEG